MNVHIGDTGLAVTVLSPSGYVEIGGVRRSAKSDGSYIEAGSAVVVVRGEVPSFVVRRIEVGERMALPHHGEPVAKAEHQMKAADVAEAEREQRRLERAALKARVRVGAAAAVAFGSLAGLANAGLAWHFNWAGVNESTGLPLLLVGSTLAGCGLGVVLYFFTGWFVARVLPAEADAVFEPSFPAILMGLVGAALGFWVNFASGDVSLLAAWTAGLSLTFAALAAGLAWVVGVLT